MGDLKTLTYDGINYLQDYGRGEKVKDLYAHFRFWGEDPNVKGIYLKFTNGLKSKKEQSSTSYKYSISVPEKSFE